MDFLRDTIRAVLDWAWPLERAAFIAINGTHAPWADDWMLALSESPLAVILILALLLARARALGWRLRSEGALPLWLLLLGVAAVTGLADYSSAEGWRDWIARLRPCRDPALLKDYAVHLLYRTCGGQHGFISSHAANYFAGTVALSLFFPLLGIWRAALLLVAAAVAYSRVYLGVHYPLDVLGGALWGTLLALMLHGLFKLLKRLLAAAPPTS